MTLDRVLVTGGLGWIGSHLAQKLQSTAYEVVIVDHKTREESEASYPGLLERVVGCEVIHGDCASREVVDRIHSGEFSQVYHLAACPRVPWSMKNPVESFDQNLQKTILLLEACRRAQFQSPRFVFASSAAVYGDQGKVRLPQGMITSLRPKPMSPYGLHKWMSEEHCEWYRKEFRVDTVCLRYFNVFGPGQVPEDAYSTVICRWLSALKTGSNLYVYGDGNQERDYVSLDTVVTATFRAGTEENLPWGRDEPRILNVGSGVATSTREVLDRVLELPLGGVDPPKVFWTHDRAGDVPWTLAGGLRRTRKVLGDIPKRSFVEDLERTWKWWQEQP